MKYKEWLTTWLENYIKPTHKIRTYDLYKQTVEKKIVPYLGNHDMDELTPIVVQRYVADMVEKGNLRTGKGLSSNSVNGIISVIQSSLQTAYRLVYTKEYIGDKIKRPKTFEKQIECFNIAEQKKIEETVMSGKKQKLFGIVICLYPVSINDMLNSDFWAIILEATDKTQKPFIKRSLKRYRQIQERKEEFSIEKLCELIIKTQAKYPELKYTMGDVFGAFGLRESFEELDAHFFYNGQSKNLYKVNGQYISYNISATDIQNELFSKQL